MKVPDETIAAVDRSAAARSARRPSAVARARRGAVGVVPLVLPHSQLASKVPGHERDTAIAKPTARKADADEPKAAVQENATV